MTELDVTTKWKKDLKRALKTMSPYKFEEFCRELVKAMGVEIDENVGVKKSRDEGLDGFGYITSEDFRTVRIGIQAKRYGSNNHVGYEKINSFRGALINKAEYGILITTSTFTKDAKDNARGNTPVITLIDGDGICDLVAKYQLHVTPVTVYRLGDFYKNDDMNETSSAPTAIISEPQTKVYHLDDDVSLVNSSPSQLIFGSKVIPVATWSKLLVAFLNEVVQIDDLQKLHQALKSEPQRSSLRRLFTWKKVGVVKLVNGVEITTNFNTQNKCDLIQKIAEIYNIKDQVAYTLK